MLNMPCSNRLGFLTDGTKPISSGVVLALATVRTSGLEGSVADIHLVLAVMVTVQACKLGNKGLCNDTSTLRN